MLGPSEPASGADWGSPSPHHNHHNHGFYSPAAESKQSNMLGSGGPCMYPTKMNTPPDHPNRSPLPKSVYQDGPEKPREYTYQHDFTGGNLDDRSGPSGGLDASQLHNIYGNHRNHSTSSNSPPLNASSGAGGQGMPSSSIIASTSSTIVVPQPVNIKPTLSTPSSATISAVAAAAAAAANGTGRKYQCKMCPQIFMHKSAMQHHAREIHRGELKPHQCQQCLKSFSSNHQLTQHIRIHTGEKPYKCSYCDRRFKQLSHVQQHTRLHTGERPYKCHLPECGRAFIQLSNLQQHLRNHDSQMERSKNRPFHCTICGKGFATESSLRTHTSKQHASLIGGQNSQSCPVCHKMFLGTDILMDHLRTAHKDPNASGTSMKRRTPSHTCPVCGKTYVNEGSLRKHIASHPEASTVRSPIQMWPCSVCQSVFTQESGLLHHMESMRMDPKHQFAAQYVLSRAAAERREKEGGSVLSNSPGAHHPADHLRAMSVGATTPLPHVHPALSSRPPTITHSMAHTLAMSAGLPAHSQ